MRNFVDIDDDLWKAAVEYADDDGLTISQMLSQMLRKVVPVKTPRKRRVNVSKLPIIDGIPTLPSRGEVITYEHVQRLMDEGEY